jgi:hypothetical protein
MPTHLVLGNHDGEEAWNAARVEARKWRLAFYPGPTDTTYPEGGHPDGNYYAFSWGSDANNKGGVQFIVLDVTGFSGPPEPRTVEVWTLGAYQKRWFESVLKGNEHDWVFTCFHHVLGGWPTGPGEENPAISYGRGPLFTERDYADFADPSKIEQVALTDLAGQYGMRAFIYGHDHIFKVTRVGTGLNGKDLNGICVGSTKRNAEETWWRGAYWKKYYGDGFKANPDFYGPSGISRLTLAAGQARMDYICTGQTPNTNLPQGGVEGVLYSSAVFVNAAPSLQIDKTSLDFIGVEHGPTVPPQLLRVRNSGGRVLNFKLKTAQPWIKMTPDQGSSAGLWVDVSVAIAPQKLLRGSQKGTLHIECAEAGVPPQTVQINLTIARAGLTAAQLNSSGRDPSGGIR